jgi:hypothetical protein
MGASSWYYFVPYQADINKALYKLREDIFKKGEYGARWTHVDLPLAQMESGETARQFPDIPPEQIDKLKAELQKLQKAWPLPKRKPETIAVLVKQSGATGTHSIIDMTDVSPSPAHGKVSLCPQAQLLDLFGTDKPTRNMVEARLQELSAIETRWHGYYLIIYEGEVPREILFFGSSGD